MSDKLNTEERGKRTRTSPRVKALDEVLVMLTAMSADLTTERAETDDEDLVKVSQLDAEINRVNDIVGRVTSLSNDGPSATTYGGRHYIGIHQNGARSAFDSNVPPTVRSHGPGTKTDYTSVLGPFRTEDGVAYRIENPDTECPVVF